MINTELKKASDLYVDSFETYYRIWFRGFEASSLIKHEKILSDLLDIDLLVDSLLIDEVVKLHSFIRDECVRRVALSCKLDV